MSERQLLTLERTFDCSPTDVWELWTTKQGIEAWWGPDGFRVTVHAIDVRPGGSLEYSMRAVDPDQVDFMRKAGMPQETRHSVVYTEVEAPRRVSYTAMADFIPGVEPYEIRTDVTLHAHGESTRLVLSFDRMHADDWNRLAVMGRESELDRLGRLIAARA